jgi:DNA-binding MarR family transcriptional regulator
MADRKPPGRPRATQRRANNRGVVDVLNGIRRLDRGLRVAAREVQRATGLSAAQLFVLEQLVKAPGASLNDLATLTLTDRSSVSVVVDRLVAAGLASRSPSREDRRRAEVHITAAGRKILDRAPPAPTDLLLAGLRKLSSSRRRSLGIALTELNQRLGFRDAQMLFASDAD